MPGQDTSTPQSHTVILQSLSSDSSDQETCQKMKMRKGHISQPPNTIIYVVKPDDKLTSIAASFDTTPSVLKKVNRLTMDFLYPDQTLYIPLDTARDSARSSDASFCSSSSFEDEKTTSTSSHVHTTSDPGLRYPGFAHRLQDIDSLSFRQQTSYSSEEGSVEGSVEGKTEDYDHCLTQMFVKIQSHYMVTEEAEVKGTLLVTPNAVMFDPNVSDPLVLENGVEEYGMIAKLDTVISAAIYRDSQAMHNLRLQKEDPTVSKPEIFHLEGCHLATNTLNEDCIDGETHLDMGDVPLSCSCGADNDTLVISNTSSDNLATQDLTNCSPGVAHLPAEPRDNCCRRLLSSQSNNHENMTPNTDIPSSHCNRNNILSGSLSNNDNTVSSPINCSRPIELQAMHASVSLDESGFDYNLDDGPISQSIEKRITSYPIKRGHRRNASTESSLYSVGMNSNTEVYVDYSCGMFASHTGTSSTDCDLLRKAMLAHHNKKSVDLNDGKQTTEEPSKPRALLLEDGVSKEERPGLFQPISDLVSETTKEEETSCNSYYLCLQVGQPINSHSGTDTCPIEAYSRRKKPEYWFTIPGDKAEPLYKFFIQWRPELYGEEITDECILNSRGFIAIPPEGLDTRQEKRHTPPPLVRTPSNVQVLKDWEILSIDEILRRQSFGDLEKYVPLPDMRGESVLMSEDNIKKITMCLPARVEGHRWRLAYSNEEHGFSLNTLYRNMCEFESATILVVVDSNGAMFGAFSSAPLHQCEHFYGTGECFLFSFVDGFKSYPWSRKNMFCVRGGLHGLTFGSGSSTCGLWLDVDIYHGRTQHCDTFDNEPLTGGDEDFIVKGIEVWSLNDEDYD